MTPKRSVGSEDAAERARWRPQASMHFAVAAVTLMVAMGMLLVSAEVSSADKIIWKSGNETIGRIVAESNGTVTLVVPRAGGNVRMEVPRSSILAVVKNGQEPKVPAAPATGPAPTPTSGPAAGVITAAAEKTYYPLPIVGEIGKEVKADVLEVALEDALKARPDYIVFYIDSGGGSVEETRAIVEVIAMAEGVKFVAVVKQALSAAAVIALTCPDIYMSPTAVMGGAVPYKIGPDGTPQAVEEKFKSVIRAQFRSAADLGGHPTVLVEAMMDPDMELYIQEKDGKKTLAAVGPGKLIKAKGKILSLTAKEAIDAGIAKGRVRKMDQIYKAMDLESWTRIPGKGWDIMAARTNAARREQLRKDQADSVAAQRKVISPELRKISDELKRIIKDLRLANSEMNMMEGEYKREAAAINAAYDRDRRQARKLGMTKKVQEREALIRRATSNRENSLNSLRRQFEPRVRGLRLRIQGYVERQKNLHEKRRALLRPGVRR